jgi:hypothetical protein
MATKEKKVPVLNVGYSDKSGVIAVTDPKSDDAEVGTLNIREMAGESTPEPLILSGIRYFAGYLRDAVASAEKAKKDTADAVTKAIAAVREGTLQFRERGGDGGLSTEQEFDIIADVLVTLGVVPDKAAALAAVKEKYDITKEVTTPARGTPAQGVEGQPGYVPASADYREEKKSTVRPEYRKLKGVAAVAEALTKAQKVDSVDELAALGIKKVA